jgi:ABC-type branched-subunit amino acid transport system ATPase component
MNNGNYILQTDKATIRFGGLVAVNELTMNVAKGEIYGLIGPNGAGERRIDSR